MGVKGLWQLLAPSGKPMAVERLQGICLGVDLSIWLHQAMHGRLLPNDGSCRAYLKVLYRRLLKLLFYGIRAVFVFDGPEVSSLKSKTRHVRRLKQGQAALKSRRLHEKLLKHLAAKAADQLNLTNSPEHVNPVEQDVTRLEVVATVEPEVTDEETEQYSMDDDWEMPELEKLDEESLPALPQEMQFQYYSSLWSAPCSSSDLPEDSDEFCSSQLKRLLRRSELGAKMAELRREIILQDPVVAHSISEGRSMGELFELKKVLSRDYKHHLIFEEEKKSDDCASDDCIAMEQKEVKLIDGKGLLMMDDSECSEEEEEEEEWKSESSSQLVGIAAEVQKSELSETWKQPVEKVATNVTTDVITILPCQRGGSDSEKISDQSRVTLASCSIDSDESDEFVEVEELPEHCWLSIGVCAAEQTDRQSRSTSASSSPVYPVQAVEKEKEVVVVEEKEEVEVDERLLREQKMKLEARERTILSQILEESEALIRCFGMPVVKSAAEAEAQCAWLEQNGLTSGTVTDDSDIWPFGGRHVYRNLFNANRTLEQYDLSTINNIYGFSRETLILLAMLVGCDYSAGVDGVGAVTAVEVLAEFEAGRQSDEHPLDALRRFRDWCENAGSQVGASSDSADKISLRKLTGCRFPDSFPDPLVYDAFLRPRVKHVDGESLRWNLPDVDGIRRLVADWFGWSSEETDKQLLPVVKRMTVMQTCKQRRIDAFCVSNESCSASGKEQPTSRRLRTAVGRLKSSVKSFGLMTLVKDTSSKRSVVQLGGFCLSEEDSTSRPKRTRRQPDRQ